MKRTMKLMAALGLAAVVASANVSADVTLDIYLPNITPRTGTAILLVDGDDDGFGDLTFASHPSLVNTRWSPDADDTVVKVWNLTGTDPDGALVATFYLNPPVSMGDKLLFVFYPSLVYSPALLGPGPNQPFGFYRDNDGGDPYGYGLGPSFIGWEVPADGSGLNIYRENSILANFITVPEPTSGVLVGLSVLGLIGALRRRS